MRTETEHNMVQRIEAFGPRAEGQRRCSIEHLKSLYPGAIFGEAETLEDVAAHFLVQPKENQEYLLQFIVDIEEEALHTFTRSCFRNSFNSSSFSRWPSLHFTDSGISRLANIAGYLQGLADAGVEFRKLALKMALDLSRWLDYLNNYGGDENVQCQSDSKSTIKAPRYRVSLSDDGTLHGFSLGWYRSISNVSRLEEAESLRQQRFSGVEQLAQTEQSEALQSRIWDGCIAEADANLKLSKDLALWRHYTPSWSSPESTTSCSDVVHYGYAYCGGLIFHGPGAGETFTVQLGKSDRYWGVHT